MNPTRMRRAIRRLAGQRRYAISSYCAVRMLERSVSERDIVAILKNASRCWRQDNGRWRLEGTDSDGDRIYVLIEMQQVVVVVNAFRGDEDEDDEG